MPRSIQLLLLQGEILERTEADMPWLWLWRQMEADPINHAAWRK
jgi:hypothetical protein